jgi:phage baseplate assembly protein gpV
MGADAVKGTKRLTTANTPTNATAFLIEQTIRDTVNTAEVVSIDGADQSGTDGPAGYAAATPLVCQTDGFDQTLPPASIAKMPFFRPQAGKAAIVMDPQPGDKAILIAMKRDSSGVAVGKNDPSQPGSFRTFDQADGYLVNGFLGEQPEIWLHLNPVSGDISLSTKAANVEITCRESGDMTIKTGAGSINIECTQTAIIKAPQIILDGNVRITGNLTVVGTSEGPDGAAFETRGGINNIGGGITSNGITLDTHTHTGVQPGGGDTGSPNGGT